jgi:hypothetical protein
MTDKEAMQMALDALLLTVEEMRSLNGSAVQQEDAIETLRTALAQPKKEWVGLTDEEYELMAEKRVTNYFFNTLDYAHDIEAKLKEKNT